jgi:hypothetical protein
LNCAPRNKASASKRAATNDADPPNSARVEAGWRTVPGQRSGISWAYLLLLAGVPQVKPDRMIRRFVADALQVADIGPQAAAQLVTAVQQATPGVSLTALDHAIWQYQRGRRRAASPAAARPRRAVDGA